jgi:hypothetical protein
MRDQQIMKTNSVLNTSVAAAIKTKSFIEVRMVETVATAC